jgi:hypothetical protein
MPDAAVRRQSCSTHGAPSLAAVLAGALHPARLGNARQSVFIEVGKTRPHIRRSRALNAP